MIIIIINSDANSDIFKELAVYGRNVQTEMVWSCDKVHWPPGHPPQRERQREERKAEITGQTT